VSREIFYKIFVIRPAFLMEERLPSFLVNQNVASHGGGDVAPVSPSDTWGRGSKISQKVSRII